MEGKALKVKHEHGDVWGGITIVNMKYTVLFEKGFVRELSIPRQYRRSIESESRSDSYGPNTRTPFYQEAISTAQGNEQVPV